MTTHETDGASRRLAPADWATVQPEVDRLLAADLTPEYVAGWLKGWSDLQVALDQGFAAAMRATNENTADEAAEKTFLHFVEEIMPRA